MTHSVTEGGKMARLAKEAADLRKPQKHDYQWYRRIDRLLDQVAALATKEQG